jgi:hypothetical protein
MGFSGTVVIYGVIGLVVAFATVLREARSGGATKALSFLGAMIFWPIFATILIGSDRRREPEPGRSVGPKTRAIADQLAAAKARLDHLPPGVLSPEIARVRGLFDQLGAMARRLDEMDQLLGSREFDAKEAKKKLEELGSRADPDDPRVESVRARLRNIERLERMRGRSHADLERAILKIEEMIAQIALLQFADRPEAEVVKHIKEIADGVEEIAEGLWSAA